MFESHSNFICPDDNTVVWKYMDLFKFLDLISTNKLFMLKINEYPDKNDGKDNNTVDSYKRNLNPNILHNVEYTVEKHFHDNIELNNKIRNITYLNCWHMNEYESSVMWDSYADSNGGIAIKTTVKRIKDSIIDERQIFIGKIIYSSSSTPLGNVFDPVIIKSEIFRDERELRLFHADLATIHNAPKHKFIKIDIDVNELIESVYFHPQTLDWVAESLKAIILKLNPSLILEKSKIYS